MRAIAANQVTCSENLLCFRVIRLAHHLNAASLFFSFLIVDESNIPLNISASFHYIPQEQIFHEALMRK
jgi:hypothetical protein